MVHLGEHSTWDRCQPRRTCVVRVRISASAGVLAGVVIREAGVVVTPLNGVHGDPSKLLRDARAIMVLALMGRGQGECARQRESKEREDQGAAEVEHFESWRASRVCESRSRTGKE